MQHASSDISLNYVTALTPQGLVQSCFKNNILKNRQFEYHSIQFVNKVWYAWYHEKIDATTLLQPLKKVLR